MTCCRERLKNKMRRLQYTGTNYDEVKQLCGDVKEDDGSLRVE